MPERIQIDVIPDNLRHEETIVQIAKVLDDLDSAVSYIFECVDQRLSQNGQRLSNVQGRAAKLQDRLQYLQTNLNLKAVKMYSAAKYPANRTYKEYQMAIPLKRRTVSKIPGTYKSSVPIKDISDAQLSSNCKTEDGQYAANTNLQEKLQFYHVRSKPRKETHTNQNNEEPFPPHLSSVSALLLFDSTDNPYEKLTKRHSDRHDKQQIEDAPDSIVQPWLSSEMDVSSNYFYTPTLGEVPQINVPPTLPDLPGIVDDEKFILDLSSQSPIAPSSAVTTPTVRPDLPTPTSTDGKESHSRHDQNAPNLPALIEDENRSSKPLATFLPLSPPPVPSQISTDSPNFGSTTLNSDISNQPPAVAPPPPPPPPPPPLPPPSSPPPSPPSDMPVPPTASSEESKIRNSSESGKPSNADDRSNLMAAIRKAGGVGRAKLRRTIQSENNTDRWSSASVGGDLMADLHAKLALRRKGIAGSGSGALERMSNMIPPPPKPNEASTSDRNSATSEYDSQPDTDDWDE